MTAETIRWKSARRPPKDERTVLAFDSKLGVVGVWYDGVWENEYSIYTEITHWAEMPKGPRK